ncbi:MAG: helix-turn-helix transcriptional regulator [Pseudomonadota bacterium]
MNSITPSAAPIRVERKNTGQDPRLTIGDNVRKIRRELKLSQEELALEADMDQAYVSRVESGACNATILIIVRLADALNVPPDYLLKATRK